VILRAAFFITFLTVVACGDSRNDAVTVNKVINTDSDSRKTTEQITSDRVIVIDSGDDASVESALDDLIEAGQGFTIAPDPVVQTVLPDGTVVFDLGNQFVRPLIATIDCNGNVKSSHNTASTTAIGSCQPQRSKKQ